MDCITGQLVGLTWQSKEEKDGEELNKIMKAQCKTTVRNPAEKKMYFSAPPSDITSYAAERKKGTSSEVAVGEVSLHQASSYSVRTDLVKYM